MNKSDNTSEIGKQINKQITLKNPDYY